MVAAVAKCNRCKDMVAAVAKCNRCKDMVAAVAKQIVVAAVAKQSEKAVKQGLNPAITALRRGRDSA